MTTPSTCSCQSSQVGWGGSWVAGCGGGAASPQQRVSEARQEGPQPARRPPLSALCLRAPAPGPAGPKPWELLPNIEAPLFIAWGWARGLGDDGLPRCVAPGRPRPQARAPDAHPTRASTRPRAARPRSDRDPFTPLDGPVGKFCQELADKRPATTFALLPDVGHCPQVRRGAGRPRGARARRAALAPRAEGAGSRLPPTPCERGPPAHQRHARPLRPPPGPQDDRPELLHARLLPWLDSVFTGTAAAPAAPAAAAAGAAAEP
jgi:hypothetical protein